MSDFPYGTVLACKTEGYASARVMVIGVAEDDIFPRTMQYRVVVLSPYDGYTDTPDSWGRIGEVKSLMVEGGSADYEVVE